VHRDKRQYLRLDTQIPCTVCLSKGDALSAVVVNLSLGGLKFSCGHDTAHRLLPRDQWVPGQVSGVTINIHFDLQSPPQEHHSYDVTARVIHSERLAQDVFHVGVQFLDIEDDNLARLQGFIESHRP
jgi:hypothetical protein